MKDNHKHNNLKLVGTGARIPETNKPYIYELVCECRKRLGNIEWYEIEKLLEKKELSVEIVN